MSKKTLLAIFILALFLRVYKLGIFPVGFHSDEARVAWNSYSILKTGKDDRGNFLSLYYDTFGDYRPTGIFYFTIPSLIIFGKNEFAVRFPSALFGALTVFPLYFFIVEILKKQGREPENIKNKIALASSFLLAISPWHIEVSRATSEVIISTFFALSAMYFLVRLIKFGKSKDAIFTAILITISFFLYHSIRLLAPLFFLTITLFYLDKFKISKSKWLIIGNVIFVFLLSIFLTFTPEAKMRLNQVSITSDLDTKYEIDRLKSEGSSILFDGKYVVLYKRFLTEYSKYFSGQFLIGNSAKPYRYTTPGTGLLTIFELVILLIGIYQILRGKRNLLPLLLLVISPLPSALTVEDAPNLHRAFFMVPFLLIIESYGLIYIFNLKNKYKNSVRIIAVISLVTCFIYFSHMYLNHSELHKPFVRDLLLDGSSYRNVGTKEMVIELSKLQNQYDKIVVTDTQDDPYPWYAFFTGKDPTEFNPYAITRKAGPWKYQNIIFSHMRCPSNSAFKTEKESRLLVVDAGAPDCAYESSIEDGLEARVIDKVLRPDGSEVYVLLERK